MSVEELMARLQEFPGDLPVEVLSENGAGSRDITIVGSEDDRFGKTIVMLSNGWEGLL